jgi:hypothetical protein
VALIGLSTNGGMTLIGLSTNGGIDVLQISRYLGPDTESSKNFKKINEEVVGFLLFLCFFL